MTDDASFTETYTAEFAGSCRASLTVRARQKGDAFVDVVCEVEWSCNDPAATEPSEAQKETFRIWVNECGADFARKLQSLAKSAEKIT